MLAGQRTRSETLAAHPELNAGQRSAVDELLQSREKIVGLDGVAGAGKTTTLAEAYTRGILSWTARARFLHRFG